MSETFPDRLYVPTADPIEERARRSRSILYDEERSVPDVWSERRADEEFTAELRARVRGDRDAVVITWGEPGTGKSTFVLDRARKVDPTFTPETLPDRVAFRADQIPGLYENTPRYGVAWIDEAGSAGLLSTEPAFSPRQRAIVEMVNLIRFKNVVLFVVIPDPDNLTKSFRVRRADYRVETQKEGVDEAPFAYMGRKVVRRHFLMADSKWLGFSDEEHGVALRWPEYRNSPDPTLRAYWDAYFPLKTRFADKRIPEIRRMLERSRRREEGVEDDG